MFRDAPDPDQICFRSYQHATPHRGRLQARGTIAVPQHRRRAVTVRSLVLRIPTDLQRITGNATIDAERTDGSNAPCTGTYAIEYVKS